MILQGKPVSAGFAVGKAYRYQAFSCEVQAAYFEKGQEREHLARFESALEKAKEELAAMVASFPSEQIDKTGIFAAHQAFLEDEEILEMIRCAISAEQKQPDYAIASVFEEFIELLNKAKDPLMAARAADLCDVRNRLLRVLQNKPEKNLAQLPERVIVVAHDLLPSDTATLDRAHVVGIITEMGSITSHSAILARSYQLPAVVGAAQAMDLIPDGALLALDAVSGEIAVQPDDNMLTAIKSKTAAFEKARFAAQQYAVKPVITADGQAVKIGVNIGSDRFTIPAESYDFVGLFRTEFLYMERAHWPTEEEQLAAYRRVLQNACGKTVTLRTLDIGGDKTLPYLQLLKEDNPFLGQRALRLCFARPDIFATQLRAALRASAYGSMQIMFPMVASIEDIRNAKAAVAAAKMQLRAEGLPFDEQIRLGIMIEVPSIACIADLAAQEVDFASVGTNDLTQYLCAADRMNPTVGDYYQGVSPAMLRMLSFVLEQFDARSKPVSVCGELAGTPLAAVLLAGLGLRSFSMSEGSLADVKAALSQADLAQAQKWACACKSLATQAEVLAYMAEKIEDADNVCCP